MMLGFAIALANANEPGTTAQSAAEVSNSDQMRSCTDRNGVTFRKGEAGFAECISWMQENRPTPPTSGDEMSGTRGATTPDPLMTPETLPSPNSITTE
jgi:hypothetical protein